MTAPRHGNARRGPGDPDQGRQHHRVQDHVASELARRKDRSAGPMGIKLLHEHSRGEHDHRDEHRRDRGGQHRSRPVSRLEDRKRDKAGVRHRGGPSLHGRPRKPVAAECAQRGKDDREAHEGAAAERNQEAPCEEGSRRLMRDRDDQERRHRDVIGEVDQGVAEVAGDISQIAGEPSGHDHREHRQDEIGDLHLSQARADGPSALEFTRQAGAGMDSLLTPRQNFAHALNQLRFRRGRIGRAGAIPDNRRGPWSSWRARPQG